MAGGKERDPGTGRGRRRSYMTCHARSTNYPKVREKGCTEE